MDEHLRRQTIREGLKLYYKNHPEKILKKHNDRLGYKLKEETKNKIGASNKKYYENHLEKKIEISNKQKGQHHSPNTEFKKNHKMIKGSEKGWFTSERLKGNKNRKDKKSWNSNKINVYSKETLEKMSIKKRGEFYVASLKLYTNEFNRKFKEKIRERDNYCCVVCNISENILNYTLSTHHIDYDKTNTIKQNCVSLCKKCHANTNINRTRWKTFFQNLLEEYYGYKYTIDNKIIIDLDNEVKKW
jgi:hypothetical protein